VTKKTGALVSSSWTLSSAKDLRKHAAGKEALAKYPNDSAIRSSQALLLGENEQTDEAVKMLRVQLTKSKPTATLT